MNIRKIKRSIKKNYGKKGLRFSRDVVGNICNAKHGAGLIKSVMKGVTVQKEIKAVKEEVATIMEFRELLKTSVNSLSALPYVVLILKGMMNKGDERVCEIAISITPELEKVYEEIDNGLYDIIRDEPSELMDNLFIKRFLVAANLTREEMNIVKDVTSEEFAKMIHGLDKK